MIRLIFSAVVVLFSIGCGDQKDRFRSPDPRLQGSWAWSGEYCMPLGDTYLCLSQSIKPSACANVQVTNIEFSGSQVIESGNSYPSTYGKDFLIFDDRSIRFLFDQLPDTDKAIFFFGRECLLRFTK